MTASETPTVKLDGQGLVTAICQDAATGQVLMVAHMSPESLKRTLEGGDMVFYSRSRQELWRKGETSGNYLHVQSAEVDCDGDVLLFQVNADGPACHTGRTSCFFTPLSEEPEYERTSSGPGILQELFQVIRQRQQERPQGSYTASLFEAGRARIAQKVVEEAGETAIAGVRGNHERIASEVADLLYHTLVLMSATGLSPDSVWSELRSRRG